MRYPMVFMDAEDVYNIQDAIEESIAVSLKQRPSLKGSLRQKRGGGRRKRRSDPHWEKNAKQMGNDRRKRERKRECRINVKKKTGRRKDKHM